MSNSQQQPYIQPPNTAAPPYYPPPATGEGTASMPAGSEKQQEAYTAQPASGPPPATSSAPEAYYSPPPPRPQEQQPNPAYNPQEYANKPTDPQHLYAPPPKRNTNRYSGAEDVSSSIHYTRDPKKLVAYLVPFPKPRIPDLPAEKIPDRFLIYTPPPPPFVDQVPEGEKEGRVHKVQRKWQDEIREAKTGNAKTMSWKGVKGKAIKGINWGMGQTKSSNLEFLNRIGGGQPEAPDAHAEDGKHEEEQTKATVKLEEMLLIYPSSMSGSPEQIREEFINQMLRSKSKAQRDAVIATGLLPVSAAIDLMLTFVWPFGGLLEIDGVWAYSSIRGAKTSRSVTKRLTSTSQSGSHEEDKLHLSFTPSARLAVLEQYLAARCHDRDNVIFPSYSASPSESEVLEAIGWYPSSKGGAERNWEDEQWEISEVKDDLKSVMGKGAKEWDKW